MSSGAPYPAPIQTNGSIYNSDDYANSTDGTTSVSTNESNVFTQLQYCSSAEPLATDTSTVIPTTQWVQGAIVNGAINSAYVNVANTFSAIQNCSAILPASSDSTNIIPTTSWVQGAITTKSTNNAQINLPNVFTQLQSCSATSPATSDSSNTLATTAWVKSAITSSNATVTLTSTTAGTTAFAFPITGLSGNYYTFVLYNQLGMNSEGNGGSGGGSFSNVSGGVLASGFCCRTTLTNTSGTQITYCAGFQQTYSWSQQNAGYIPQINNVDGNTFTKVNGSFGSTSENTGVCPPNAGAYGGSFMNFTLGSAIASQNLIMVLKLIG